MKAMIITGASSGIGTALCKCYAENGYYVFGSVRNRKDAKDLNVVLGDKGESVIFDVTKKDEIRKAYKQIAKKTSRIEMLINNAGIALPAPLELTSESDFMDHFSINVMGALNCIQIFLPLLKATMITSKPPQIINISSGGGKRGSPFLGAYCMSKHAIEGFSKVLRQEMLLYGIEVCVIAPGAIKTNIWDKGRKNLNTNKYSTSKYSKYMVRFSKWLQSLDDIGLSAENFALKVFKISQKRFPPIRIVIHPRPFIGLFLQDILPTRFFNKLYAKKLGFPKR